MKFGVIVCNKCHHAVGINLQFKSTTCPFCNLKLSIIPEKVQHQSNSEVELAKMISKINEHLLAQNNKNIEDGSYQLQSFELDNFNSDGPNQDKSTKNGSAPEVYEQLNPYKRIALKYKSETESITAIRKIIMELGLELGEFTRDDFKELLLACDFSTEKADEYLEQLKSLDIIFEPRPEKYRLIDD